MTSIPRGEAEPDANGKLVTPDPWARVGKALASGNRTRREDVAALHGEVERLRLLTDPDLTFRDLEAKVRDGTFDMKIRLGEEHLPVTKFLAAMMWNFLLGEEGEPKEPDNYQSIEVTHTHYGERIRCYMEVVKPGGKSSREIRADLEAEVERLRAERAGSESDKDANGSTSGKSERDRVAEVIWRWRNPNATEAAWSLVKASAERDPHLLYDVFRCADEVLAAVHHGSKEPRRGA